MFASKLQNRRYGMAANEMCILFLVQILIFTQTFVLFFRHHAQTDGVSVKTCQSEQRSFNTLTRVYIKAYNQATFDILIQLCFQHYIQDNMTYISSRVPW